MMTRKSKTLAKVSGTRRLDLLAGHFNEQIQSPFAFRGQKKSHTPDCERATGEQPKELDANASEFDLLLYSTLTLQQTRVIAQTLQDTLLLSLVDLAIVQVDESLNRHLYSKLYH